MPGLLRDDDEAVFGDAGYASDTYKRGARQLGMSWCVNDKRKPGQGKLERLAKKSVTGATPGSGRGWSMCFRIIKCQFGYRKVRYKGLAKKQSTSNELDGAGQCVSAAPVVDGVMSASLRLKKTQKWSKSIKKEGITSLKRDSLFSKNNESVD